MLIVAFFVCYSRMALPVEREGEPKDWKYKQWMRAVTVVTFALIFLVWGGLLSFLVIIFIQSSKLDFLMVSY